MPVPEVAASVIQIALATFALWLAWETRGLRRATLSLLAATRSAARLSLAPYLYLEVGRNKDTHAYTLRVVNESTALAVQIDCFIYDSKNKNYLQFLQLTHSKAEDDDMPALLPTPASRDEVTERVLSRNNGSLRADVASVMDCGERSAAIAFFQDAEERLYATRRYFTDEAGTLLHIKQQRRLLSDSDR